MGQREASLSDKFDLAVPHQLLSGTQAIVRLTLMQKARDEAAGLDIAGYITGYRGSPIATIENAFARAQALTTASNIVFQPAVNEDLAATAIWGAQQAELRGEGKYDGVFAIWYGKGPGVDRSGDAFRHANHAGTSKYGGVLALLGDDHTCESSTSAHQSEFALVDAMIPILNPAGVQEVLDYGLYGFALSRYAGVWVGLKCVKDNFESTATVDANLDRVRIRIPSSDEFPMPPGGVNIRLQDAPLEKEARLHDAKQGAALAFVRANGLDHIVMSGGANPKIGIITTGKSYLDTRQALDELGIDEVRANELGLRLYKVAMTWPLEPDGIERFARGLDLVLVIEEKRALIESQVKEQLFDWPQRPQVFGKKDETGNWLFPAKGALESLNVAIAVGERILRVTSDEQLATRLQELKALKDDLPAQTSAIVRTAYFCAGCPHSSSTVIPHGARAYAGIGCHYLAQWMDRSTEGFTQMGAEGANWIGEAPFSKRRHVFQNIGDGTYVHSGSLAIRAAIAAGTNVTYKILYNDAVAMTGGQKPEGNFTVAQMAAQMLAEGAAKVVVVSDEPHKYGPRGLPRGARAYHRRELMHVQEKLSAIDGVTVLIYDQTCAAEKRRRRKRGALPDPAQRVFINPLVCEGCGDCGIKSNCVAILPLETEFGRKRAIDQSACNKDYSCLDGFCPSFVTLTGAQPKRSGAVARDVDTQQSLPEPALPPLDKPYAILVTGVGGT
ncbi:MAG: indolepyruvate ferredoxin oxidoreductase family protein, partial [Hyphomicrobium sp.]